MKRCILATLAVLALGACEPTQEKTPIASGQPSLTAEDDGSHVTLKVEDTFSIKLESVPTAGYMWLPFDVPDCIAVSEDEPGIEMTDPENQSQPGFTGGNHYVILQFEAVSKCANAQLELVEAREWELFDDDGSIRDKSAIMDRFKLRITVSD